MTKLLIKLFIKDYENIKSEKVRLKYGVLSGVTGIILNVILSVFKMVFGALTKSISIVADGANNIFDAISSVISLVGFKISGKPADDEHPFGHGRIEYISGLLVSMFILMMGFELLKSSVSKIIHPQEIVATPLVIVILLVSICIKVYMSFYNSSISKKIDSAAMAATAKDSISDSLSTVVVLITTILTYFTDLHIDGWCGVLVAFFVLWAGIGAAKDTISPLLGQPPTKEFVDRIEAIIMEYESQGVLGVHDLVVHDYGPGRMMLSVHVEVPASGDILILHDMIDLIEHRLANELGCSAVIHMDPVCVDDELTNEIKEKVAEIIHEMEGEIKFHDFRIVNGPTHTNLIFDVVVPYDYLMTDTEVVGHIREEVQKIDKNYFVVIEVDKAYR